MDTHMQDSVVLITSSDIDNSTIGTGFVIGHDRTKGLMYIVTCAHVIRGVGSPLVEQLPAEVIAIDETERIDLAVLQVSGLLDAEPFALQQAGIEGQSVIITGWSNYSFFPHCVSINGILDRRAPLFGTGPAQRIEAWALSIPDTYTLQPGYSGAPVIDTETGKVIAVATTATEGGARGTAISIAGLALIWATMPSTLLTSSMQQEQHTAAFHLVTYPNVAAKPVAGEEILDWVSLFSTDPGPQLWRDTLIPDLEHYLLQCRMNNLRQIHLRAHARNSAGFAFGFAFRKTSGFTIQYIDNYDATWRTGDTAPVPSPLISSMTESGKKGNDLIIELAVTQVRQRVQEPVTAWIKQQRSLWFKRALSAFASEPTTITPEQGLAIAFQIRNTIIASRKIGGTTHIFGAVPFGVALLIGWLGNACGAIQWYELDGAGQYQPTCLVQS